MGTWFVSVLASRGDARCRVHTDCARLSFSDGLPPQSSGTAESLSVNETGVPKHRPRGSLGHFIEKRSVKWRCGDCPMAASGNAFPWLRHGLGSCSEGAALAPGCADVARMAADAAASRILEPVDLEAANATWAISSSTCETSAKRLAVDHRPCYRASLLLACGWSGEHNNLGTPLSQMWKAFDKVNSMHRSLDEGFMFQPKRLMSVIC